MHTDPLIERTASAYAYPLLIKQLLHTPLAVAPDQEIVYRDLKRYRYRELRNRIGRLAGALAASPANAAVVSSKATRPSFMEPLQNIVRRTT